MIQYLIDTSAAARLLTNPSIRKAWHEQVTAGIVAVCDVVELELLFSATSLADRLRKKELLADLFGWVVVPDDVWPRAHRLQQSLTESGEHRSAGVVDLLVSVTAADHGLTLLHYDRDFDTVAKLTGQATQWISPPGSVP
ncbi:PIN domain nuclease [Nocardia otitidiscaviarum]|uniref:PIN domain nuclease n=1 Tax=Nocardia otitidiscaviarum TaxID=1823 RepID=UPI0004A76ED0|nr:PIN domain nuclease [Nocardia otitidiscaviarum]MBF6133860.1 PIN domain nuclease [Nocardia otitidiscaviarum]MBF6487888.1 PIN domain nuclease [Nocardia otitidiscaviarum]